MGYYILGIIIFLLLIVFISDLIRQARDNADADDFDIDEYFERLSSQYPGTFAYREDFSDEFLEENAYQEEKKETNEIDDNE